MSARHSLGRRLSYAMRCLPGYAWQRLTRRESRGPVHMMIAIADHFEPAIQPGSGANRAPYDIQEQRLEEWCRDYPKAVERWRDQEGRPLVHTHFYPAEQYDPSNRQDRALLDRLAEFCHDGWGEAEIHLHHGLESPDTADNTRGALLQFRQALEERGCLSYWNGRGTPRYAFVHGNFALANSAAGQFCGVDEEMQVLSETGCFADFTLPTNVFNRAQTAKINSLYECEPPLNRRAAHAKGRDLRRGAAPELFPLIVQGPWMLDLDRSARSGVGRIENGALTDVNPPSVRRLQLWKEAAVVVRGRPDWIFVKLHCHGMDPTQREAVWGAAMQLFLRELVEGAAARQETLHFVSAREMVNIALAACDGREGNPGEFRDYRLKLLRASERRQSESSQRLVVRG